jgi:hypothetical protein
MAGDPHNKEGKCCYYCKEEFVKGSMTMTISFRKSGMIEHRSVHGLCHHKYLEEGE